MAKLPGGGGSGRYGRAHNADRSPRHVMVVRIGRFALAAWNQLRLGPVDVGSCITPTLQPLKAGPPHFGRSDGAGGECSTFRAGGLVARREEIERGLREHHGPASDLPPRLELLVRELDKPRSTWFARLCVLAFIAAIAAASFRFHFVF